MLTDFKDHHQDSYLEPDIGKKKMTIMILMKFFRVYLESPCCADIFQKTTTITATTPPPQRLSYSSFDSETDEDLSKELHLMLAEPEEPVKQIIQQIRQNRKKAENRARRMQKRQKEAEMITEITAELDKMSFMLHNMGKWFKQFEREDTVEQATQFAYTHNVEITAELMDQLEHCLF